MNMQTVQLDISSDIFDKVMSLNIQKQEVVNFIQNKSVDELKTLFVNFLTKQIEIASTYNQIDRSELKRREPNLLKGKIIYFEDFNSSRK